MPNVISSDEPRPPSLMLKLVTEARVGDGDQLPRPLANRSSMKLGDAPFGDDGLHVGARRDHAGAAGQDRHDARAVPRAAVDGRAMIARPSAPAPRRA